MPPMQNHLLGKIRIWCRAKCNPQTLLAIMMLAGSAVAEARGRNPQTARESEKEEGIVQVLKVTPHRSMTLVRYEEEEYFAKQFHPSEFYKRFTQLCRGESNARVVGQVGLEFEKRGLHIPPILGVVEEKGSTESILITESVASCPSVEQLLEEAATLPPGKERLRYKRFIARVLAAEWHRLHAAGIHYAESHTRHIYVTGDVEAFRQGKEHGWDFAWIDYDGTRFFSGELPGKYVHQHFFNLSRDYRRKMRLRHILSHADMLCFLHFYLQFKTPQASPYSVKQQTHQMARDVLTWQPRLYTRLATPVRDGWRWITRPSERERKRQRRQQKNQKLAMHARKASQRHKHS